jgi:hypothetical protein
MKRIKYFSGILIGLLVLDCSSDPVAVDPQIASLIAPVNDQTCLDGTSINDSQSDVEFQWGLAQDALSYELVVSNLMTQSSQTYSSTDNAITITLTKAEPYSWLVRSIGEEGTNPTSSDSWKFYLAGDAITNYAPFPSELISPRSGANVTPSVDNFVTLSWSASDVDQDLLLFEVYIDQTDGTTKVQDLDFQQEETALDVEVENNKTYYWKIVAIDSNGNKSNSGVYAFRTN